MTSAPTSVFSGRLRLPTFGLLLVITLAAFEALAVATVMPTAARALGGLALYPWAFTAFLVASLVGMVHGGARADRAGPGPVLVRGLASFAAGLVLCGAAPTMPLFVLGRAVGGFGAGALIVAAYVVVGRVYDEALRPKAFAAMSAAWVVPALVGPALAGAVAEHASWRWVFAGLPPFIVLGGLLVAPLLRGLPRPAPEPVANDRRRVAAAVVLAAGVALVQAAGTRITPLSAGLAAGGLALLVPPLRRLLPAGALRLRRGLPAVVSARGLLAGAFFGAEAFLPLLLVTVHDVSPTYAGLPLTFGAVGWSTASWLQGRRAASAERTTLVRRGFAMIAVGVGALALLAAPGLPAALAVPLWALGGAGMGFAMPTLSVLLLQLSDPAEQGANSAALQIADAAASATCIALAGAVVAAAMPVPVPRPVAVAAADLLMASIALAGVLLAGRLRTGQPGRAGGPGVGGPVRR